MQIYEYKILKEYKINQMKYLYTNAKLPDDKNLLTQIDAAAGRLHRKLVALNLSKLGISEYNQRYIGDKLQNPIGSMQLYSYLLAWALDKKASLIKDFVIVDYGGGSGIFSLLAKELGIGKVIYNDIYDVSCKDARLIARATDLKINDYVCGDIDDLIDYVSKYKISIDAISSYDVIEHIYDIEEYLRKLKFLSDKPFVVVFGSSANIHNPIITRKLKKAHLITEHTERKKEWGHKERDSLQSYFSLRREIISMLDPSLTSVQVNRIAKETRGLIKESIEKCVQEFKKNGKISYKPNHATNTCDPHTGNWNEQLIESSFIEKILYEENFETIIMNGYYSFSNRIHIRLVKNCLNMLISSMKSKALKVAPYYIVYSRKISSRG